ncbi:NAD-dependent deacetylase hst3 [Coemansia sp. RSA 552]|nr:NAD-dependent deacetylase hst3 [Coemansia sp. RSA 552]
MQRVVLGELTEGDCEAARVLGEVQRAVRACQRCIVITGAGISVSSGIPDFRSPDGLFRQLKLKYPSSVSNGRDLFDATLFHDPGMVGLFYSFMGELRNLISQATCTPTHAFIKQMDEHGKLLRCYTQNIDSLEKRIGLETSLSSSPSLSESSSGSSSSLEQQQQTQACRPSAKRPRRRQTKLDKKFTRAVQLHGDLDNVICTICHTRYPFTKQLAEEFCEGAPPPCPRCKEIESIRDIVGKRSVTAGVLRPDIVLYNEAHPQGELIGALSEYDLKRRPDLLIVIGTSLKIPGIKRMVREMSRCVHDSAGRTKRAGAGKAIFINRDEPPRGWDDVFDYYISGDADQAIDLLPIRAEPAVNEASHSQTKNALSIDAICNHPMSPHQVPQQPVADIKPLTTALPPRPKPALARRSAKQPKQKDRKITSMMKVVKTPGAIAKGAPPLRRSQRSSSQRQKQIDVPKSPLVSSS